MKKMLFCSLFLCSFIYLWAKPFYTKIDTTCNCTQVLTELSAGWKLDSLSGNGFRDKIHEKVQNCKIDSVAMDFVQTKLGKPNKTTEDVARYFLRYEYYNCTKLDTLRSHSRRYGIDFLEFIFDKSSKKLVGISRGFYE